MSDSPGPGRAAFISYSHHDRDVVLALFELLKSVGSVFLDKVSVEPGDPWRRKIDEAIASCSVFLLFWCRHSAKSEAVTKEWRLALHSARRIVPILMDSEELADELEEFQWIDLRHLWSRHDAVFTPHDEQGTYLRGQMTWKTQDPQLHALDQELLRLAAVGDV